MLVSEEQKRMPLIYKATAGIMVIHMHVLISIAMKGNVSSGGHH